MSIYYKPFSVLAGVLGGLLAGALFTRLWALLPGDGEAPAADDADAGWGEVLLSAALHGAVFGAVKALTKRASATGFARSTGTWPGEDSGSAS